jgi:atypical dual specificity phosphatase
MPFGFSWVDRPLLAALAMPDGPEDLAWLRRHGIDILISLTENTPPRQWINEAGLLSVHIPVPDMTAPSLRQFELCQETFERAKANKMGVAVHCLAGRGRTGTVLAGYFVARGLSADHAIATVRELRPGSIETPGQEAAIHRYAEKRGG